MHSVSHDETLPADAVIPDNLSKALARRIVANGMDLCNALCQIRLVTGSESAGTWTVNTDAVEYYVVTHCVVVEGEMVRTYWQRFQSIKCRETKERICTCWCFVQHAECEHVSFVSGMCEHSEHSEKLRARRAERHTHSFLALSFAGIRGCQVRTLLIFCG